MSTTDVTLKDTWTPPISLIETKHIKLHKLNP